MSGSSKTSLMVFFQILSPILIILGLIVKGLAMKDSVVPDSLQNNLTWFQENADLCNNISNGLFITGGIFVIIAILFSLSVSGGRFGADDDRMGKSLDKLRS